MEKNNSYLQRVTVEGECGCGGGEMKKKRKRVTKLADAKWTGEERAREEARPCSRCGFRASRRRRR